MSSGLGAMFASILAMIQIVPIMTRKTMAHELNKTGRWTRVAL
jgi:hypothetical protein